MKRLQHKAFAVQVRKLNTESEREYLAINGIAGVSLFNNRRDALDYADQLAVHFGPRRNMKVVRVNVTVEVQE